MPHAALTALRDMRACKSFRVNASVAERPHCHTGLAHSMHAQGTYNSDIKFRFRFLAKKQSELIRIIPHAFWTIAFTCDYHRRVRHKLTPRRLWTRWTLLIETGRSSIYRELFIQMLSIWLPIASWTVLLCLKWLRPEVARSLAVSTACSEKSSHKCSGKIHMQKVSQHKVVFLLAHMLPW